MTFGSRAFPFSFVVAATMAMSFAARADDVDKPEQKAAAQALFERGRALVEQGQFAEACPKFAESQRLDPGIGTLLWLADCYESSGRTASAWASFKEAAAAASLRHDDRERVARERAADLEPHLSRLSIAPAPDAPTSTLEVRRDGMTIGSAEWGLPLPLDPGPHTVAATAPGRRSWSVTVVVEPTGSMLSVTIPALAPATSVGPPGEGDRPSSERHVVEGRSHATGTAQRIVGLAIAGLGLGGLAVGTVFSLKARSTYGMSNSSGHCLSDNECDAIGKSDRRDAYSLATAATVIMSIGAVGLSGGAVLFFTAPRQGAPAIALVPGRRGATARVEWSW
jgi:hypothetical protein